MKYTIIHFTNGKTCGEIAIKHNAGYEKIICKMLKKFKKRDKYIFTTDVVDILEPTDELVES